MDQKAAKVQPANSSVIRFSIYSWTMTRNPLDYCVARNFCGGSLFLRIGDFLCFVETNFCDQDRLVVLAGN